MGAKESGALGTVGVRGQDLEAVRGLLTIFGDRVNAASRAFHLSLPSSSVARHVQAVVRPLASLHPSEAGPSRVPHDPTKSLARLAGASFLVQPFRDRIPEEGFLRGFTTKVLYVYLQDSLDHVLDHGIYAYEDAVRLYRFCLSPLTELDADFATLEEDLGATLRPGQEAAAAPLALLTRTLHGWIMDSPNAKEMSPYIRWVNERFARAQTASTFQRRSHLDIEAIKRIASEFWAPDPDVAWHERFAANLSWVTNPSLLDLCFARELPSPGELRDHMLAWYYFDAVISRLDHLADLWSDLREGIVNAALISIRESEPGEAWEPTALAANLADGELERFLVRTAEFERRGLRFALRSCQDPDRFYPFLGLMIPVVMLSRCGEGRTWMLPRYVRELAPALEEASRPDYHSTTYSQHASPFRTHHGLATLPWKPRDFRMPS